VQKTPIAFFIFNRPDLAQKVFTEIRRAQPSKLLIIADGPRRNIAGDAKKCASSRAVTEAVDWPCKVLTSFSAVNLGCKERLVSGLNWVFEECDQAVILEDDCLPHPEFFGYCDELLCRYRDEPKVMQISGTNAQGGRSRTQFSYYFSRYNHVWGWATWRRAWRLYDGNPTDWAEVIWSKKYRRVFTGNSERKEWHDLFRAVEEGHVDTWDCQWFLTLLRAGAFAATPDVNLISNLGFRNDATHTKEKEARPGKPTESIGSLRHPAGIRWNRRADAWFVRKALRRLAHLERNTT
jgi:hypothetical protein